MKIRFRYFFRDMREHKLLSCSFILICAVLCVLAGRKKEASPVITPQEQEEVREYNEKLSRYKTALKDYETALEEQKKTVENMQAYIDSSILMKLDAAAICYVTVQYTVSCEEGTSAGNVNQALLTYIKDGGLKENIGDSQRLETDFWGEVLSASVSGNTLNITLMHYDPALASEIMDIVEERITGAVPGIAQEQGGFSLSDAVRNTFEKAELSVVNTQNTNRNNLRSYISTMADLENKVISQQNTIKEFREKEAPEALWKANRPESQPTLVYRIQKMLKYAVFGGILGVAAEVLVWLLTTLLGNRIRCAADFEGSEMNVLGVISGKKMRPEAQRLVFDLRALLDSVQRETFCVTLSGKTEAAEKAAALLKEQLSGEGMKCGISRDPAENAQDLSLLLAAGSAVLLAEAGRTTFAEIEKQKKLCARFRIPVLGVLVIE